MSNGPKDMYGNELVEGDYIHQFLPPGCNYVVGKIVKINQGGLAVPNGPKDAVTATQIQVMVLMNTAAAPNGGNIGHLVKIAVPQAAPATPEEKAHVDKVLSLYPQRKTAGS